MMTEQDKAASYIRIREGGPSQEEQQEMISKAARSYGLRVYREFIEIEFVAACDITDRRMELFELFASVRAGEINRVIISSSEAISQKPIEAAIIALMLERNGVEVIFADEFDWGPYRKEAEDLIEGRYSGILTGQR